MSDDSPKKPDSAPGPAGDGTAVTVQLEPALVEALDRHIGFAMPGAARAEALRHIVRAWAEQHGLVDGDEGLRPDELNASNDG